MPRIVGVFIVTLLVLAGCTQDPCTDGSLPSCIPANVCGDGMGGAESDGVTEECDDGNTTPGDGCSATCTIEVGWVCALTNACANGACEPSVCSTWCGDGLVAGDELCDDQNHSLNDACPSGEGGSCVPAYCGDGFVWNVDGLEACDDGNSESGDGCSALCAIETNWACTGEPSVCSCMPGFADTDSDGVCEAS
jgi:cysteine-rich repeat protein